MTIIVDGIGGICQSLLVARKRPNNEPNEPNNIMTTTNPLIAPTGETIAQSTYMDWLEKNHLSPMDRLSPEQETEVNQLALTDTVTQSLILLRSEEKKQTVSSSLAKQEMIAIITDGLDRKSVMSLCPLKGYYPDVVSPEGLTVYANGYKSQWLAGTTGWTDAVALDGSDQGSGYGFNTDD